MEDGVILNRLGEKLAELRLSQSWLAGQLGVSENTVSNWINGRRQISWKYLYQIADLLKCDVRELIVPNDGSPWKHIRFLPGQM
jgi:transcriptional regulator with XRE-family HTH domain